MKNYYCVMCVNYIAALEVFIMCKGNLDIQSYEGDSYDWRKLGIDRNQAKWVKNYTVESVCGENVLEHWTQITLFLDSGSP